MINKSLMNGLKNNSSIITTAAAVSLNEAVAHLAKAFECAAAAASIVINNFVEMIKPVLITDFAIAASCENHRIRDLALYHRKSRVRKKNLSRIKREIKLNQKKK